MRQAPKFLIALFVFVLASCTSIHYKPELSLKKSPQKINARAKIETFVDVSPIKDRDKRLFGTSATEPNTLDGDLADEITNAIEKDFEANRLFISVDHNVENPDVIIKGTIKRFYGKSGLNPLGGTIAVGSVYPPVGLLLLLGIPVQTVEGEVDIELVLLKPDGTPMGTYSGHSKFYNWYSIYNQRMFAIGTRLNQAFGEAIGKIREQILADKGMRVYPVQ